jgi:hypothetical protein
VFQWLLSERHTPERCVEAYYLANPESIAERKLRRGILMEDAIALIEARLAKVIGQITPG